MASKTARPFPNPTPSSNAGSGSSQRPLKHPLPEKPVTKPLSARSSSPKPGVYNLTPWIDSLGMTEYESQEQRLHDEIVAFVKYVEPTPQESTARSLIIRRITEITLGRFKNCRVKTFGSIAQDLCLPDSDIDLAILPSRDVNKADSIKALRQLQARFRQQGISNDVIVVPRARVPIINMRTTTALGGLNVDLSYNNDTGLTVVKLVKEYLQAMPALRPLMLILKAFLGQRNMNSAATSGLGSFSLTIMVISFLQLNPSKRSQEVIDAPMQNESLGQLLLDFFHYYGYTFPYETAYISVADKKLGLKTDKGWGQAAQPEMIAIESLIDLQRNIGKNVTKIKSIRKAFQEAFNTLNNLPFTMASANILGSIVRFSKKTVEQREHIRRIVDGGTLQRAVAPSRPYGPAPQTQWRHAQRDRSRSPEHVSRGYHSFTPHPQAHPDSVYRGPLPPPTHPDYYHDYYPSHGPYYGSEASYQQDSRRYNRHYDDQDQRPHIVSQDDYRRHRHHKS